MDLNGMQEAVYRINKDNGWFESDRSWHDTCTLLTSEVYEMFEAYRSWGYRDVTLDQCNQHTESHICKPEGVGSELADVWVRWFDTCTRLNLEAHDFREAIDSPTPFTAMPFSYRIMVIDGRVRDLWLAEPGRDFSTTKVRLGMVLRDIFGFAAYTPEIDLEKEFRRKLAYNRTRGHKHGGKLI